MGTVLSFGTSSNGAHGHEQQEVHPPRLIPSLNNIISICVGDHTFCMDINGNAFSFGSNKWGQLGIGVDKISLQFTHEPQKVNLSPCKDVVCGENFIVRY